MLSKIYYYSENSPAILRQRKMDANPSTLLARLRNADISSFSPVYGGTLGVCYIAMHSNGSETFFKTHLDHKNARENLLKEIAILDFLYGDDIGCRKIETNKGGQIWLWMDKLTPLSKALDPTAIFEIIENYSQRLSNKNVNQYLDPADNFNYLMKRGGLVLEDLYSAGHLSTRVKKSALNALIFIGQRLHQLTPVICHGDLSPKNIMCKKSRSIVIDWEDAFFGFEGYDFLYWLTFFNNRQYYAQNIFGKTHLGQRLELSIMILILILKSGLSLSSGEYFLHKIGINDRIQEILSLDNNFLGS